MTTPDTSADPATRSRGRVALWFLQILLAVFFLVAAAGPKLVGQEYAVALFDAIGAGQWLRYLVGVLELAGAVGLLIPRLAGLAAVGLVGVMIGATLTNLVVLGTPLLALTPLVLGILLGVIAYARRAEIPLTGGPRRG